MFSHLKLKIRICIQYSLRGILKCYATTKRDGYNEINTAIEKDCFSMLCRSKFASNVPAAAAAAIFALKTH